MQVKNYKKFFLDHCETEKLEKNDKQLQIVDSLINFLNPKNKLINFLFLSNPKICFYLHGGVGVGKTMILDFFYKNLKTSKKRSHFNEFMIEFHDYKHKNSNNSVKSFAKNLKKNFELIYLDEFQVTNIVDAMILGNLFKAIFDEKIKVLISSNTKVEDLYKDGLQREQFTPFIKIIKKHSIEKELLLNEDYRKINSKKLQRAFFPISEKTTFVINQYFRELTKNKKKNRLKVETKGRFFYIDEFYEGIARFQFNELCYKKLAAEDYLNLATKCDYIFIENIPSFNEDNVNEQQRFITLIDILYDKKIPLLVSLFVSLENIGSANVLKKTFKRTKSRIYELTSPNITYS